MKENCSHGLLLMDMLFLVFYNYTCLPICQALVMTPITTGNHPESGRFIPPHGAINRLKLSRVLQYCS